MARVLQTPKSFTIRNVHLYDDNGDILGGVYQNGSITGNNFYDMCGIFLDFKDSGSASWSIYSLNNDGTTGALLRPDEARLSDGKYIVLSNNGTAIDVVPTSRGATRRVYTQGDDDSSRISDLQKHFRDGLRARDGSCAITGESGLPSDPFIDLEAVHVVPLARQDEWTARGYASWITDNAPSSRIGDHKMYSPQNGLLLNHKMHVLFDKLKIAVNPHDNYKIIGFDNLAGIKANVDGTHLEDRTTNPSSDLGVSVNVLRWHFEQAVLANMKGDGPQKNWDYDLGGGDEIEEIMQGPYAGERMEAELYNRLGIKEGVNMD